jgi:hypothetical protein
MRLSWKATATAVASLILWGMAAEGAQPTITRNDVEALPATLFYFKHSDVLLLHDMAHNSLRRSEDDGETWSDVTDIPKGKAGTLYEHPFDSTRAYVLSQGSTTHYMTSNRGKTWSEFQTPETPWDWGDALAFHSKEPDWIIFQGAMCEKEAEGHWMTCTYKAYHTKNNFKKVEHMLDHGENCQFAQSTELFHSAVSERIICIYHNKLYHSDDFFKNMNESPIRNGRAVSGIVGIATVKKFLIAAAKAPGSEEMALFVTDNAMDWDQAQFPSDHKIKQDAYTILESTNYSIQVDVMQGPSKNALGVLYTSNSNGSYFTQNIQHVNHNPRGIVDFERISAIDGIILVNVIANGPEFEMNPNVERKIQTKISFDDGRTWKDMTVGGKDKLHLHSITTMPNGGKVFSSPAPGLVMGIGNTGDQLISYNEGDLYVSDDAGLTWRLALEDAHRYEFGDQGSILVAINDEGVTSKLSYSTNHGQDWDEVDLGVAIRTRLLTTRPDSSSLKFILVGSSNDHGTQKHYMFAINFEGMKLRQCKDNDYEDWHARLDDNGKPDCIMGHTQTYRRRKKDADCIIPESYKAPTPIAENCECTEEDYECDYNFRKDGDGKCVPFGKMIIPQGSCKAPTDTYKGSSGYRKIPGDTCVGGKKLDELTDRPCSESFLTPEGTITKEVTWFDSQPMEFFYLERTDVSSGDDETIIMRTAKEDIWRTRDHGKKWEIVQELQDKGVIALWPHDYNKDSIYFITASERVYYSKDRASEGSILHFDSRKEPNWGGYPVLAFHRKNPNWLIWIGAVDCESRSECHATAYLSQNDGGDWKQLLTFVKKCEFMWQDERSVSEDLVYCEQFEHANTKSPNPVRLVSSDDWFSKSEVKFPDIIEFATMSEFIVVAARSPDDENDLQLDASVNARNFAKAAFPPNFRVDHQQAYTLLDSSTHAIFIHVTVNDRVSREYGSILKSNSNGTYYVLSLPGVNRNSDGYVDFEKVQSIEGVATANVVDNIEGVDKGEPKRIKTKITHNDGSDWAYVSAPKTAGKGQPLCDSDDTSKCSLHLHGYTERPDPRDSYSSPAAVGMMIAVGNVGEYLGDFATAQTFISRDAGITWNYAKEGRHMWEFGDQGSVIVIVRTDQPTRQVSYTVDEGQTWQDFVFAEVDIEVTDLTTVPADVSRNFLLWGREAGGEKRYLTVNLDFTGLASRQCVLNEEHPEEDDYDLWTPKHPFLDNDCLFGRVAKYHRKKIGKACYNGPLLATQQEQSEPCQCNTHDYEWYDWNSYVDLHHLTDCPFSDFNYERQSDYTCKLIDGLTPPDPLEQCKSDPELVEYYEITGYRKIKIDTCQGGRELDKQSEPKPCPGHEPEFAKKRRISGAGLFFAIVIPLLAASGVGYYVWHNWEGKFGRIRLGDTASWDSDSPFIRYPVLFLSGAVAVIAALPLLATSLWRSISSRLGLGGGYGRVYSTRDSFARGRGEYSSVEDGELLGEDSDDDV